MQKKSKLDETGMREMNKQKGIMIAAPKSGSGKTLVTCALLSVLKKSRAQVCSFKCGPDYIDPMFHKSCIKVPSENLDGFFSSNEELNRLYTDTMKLYKAEIAVVEGVMGLFDGLGGVSEEASAYSVAKALRLPVVLVVDASGMGRSILPLISGFLDYDKEKLIKGIILNKISENYYNSIKSVIEDELGIKVYGFFPKRDDIRIDSRHLGLIMPEEIEDIERKLEKAAEIISQTVDINMILSEQAFAFGESVEREYSYEDYTDEKSEGDSRACYDLDSHRNFSQPVIAVARDEAFCFYYEENLRWLERAGAKLVYFSPLWDEKLPEGINGILIGGGYPELYAQRLSENKVMKKDILDKVNNGLPIIAECGGFMYLHKILQTKDGSEYEMVGLIDAKVTYAGRLVRFGYVTVHYDKPLSKEIKGHEFHYYDSTDNGDACHIKKPVTQKCWRGIHVTENIFAGFPHLYYGSCPEFVYEFVGKCRHYADKNK